MAKCFIFIGATFLDKQTTQLYGMYMVFIWYVHGIYIIWYTHREPWMIQCSLGGHSHPKINQQIRKYQHLHNYITT